MDQVSTSEATEQTKTEGDRQLAIPPTGCQSYVLGAELE
jgi:hypothetical protein